MIRQLVPADAEYLLRAAQRLRALGRAESEFPLIAKAAEIEPSLHVLKAAFQAATDAKKLASAFRYLVQIEVELTQSEADTKWITEALSIIARSDQVKNGFPPRPRDAELAAELGIVDNEKVVGLIGPFSLDEDLDVVFDACAELVQKGEKLKLLMIADGETFKEVPTADRFRSVHPDRAPWLIQVNRPRHDQMADYYALLDTIVIARKHPGITTFMPSLKVVEAMAYGKRLVVSNLAPLADYAQKYEGVVTFAAGKADRLAESIQNSLMVHEPRQNMSILLTYFCPDEITSIDDKDITINDYKPGISIIIPSHKGERTILECLRSMLMQTLSKNAYEVIVITNGEPDNTQTLVQHFSKENPTLNIILTNSEIASAGAARNIGISIASRQYVTFVDDDDSISPNFLKALVQHASSNKIVVSNIRDFNQNGSFDSPINEEIKKYAGGEVLDYTDIRATITLNACKLLPTEMAKKIIYNDHLKSGEDVLYWSKVVCAFKPAFYCISEDSNAIYYRRVRENSVSRQPESFDFNVMQRLEVIVELEKISCNQKLLPFIDSKVNAQLGFVIRYLAKKPNEWGNFREIAKHRKVSNRAIRYVNEKHTKTLFISYCFPPYIDTSGIVCAKRLIESNKPVDVVSNTMNHIREKDSSLFDLVEPFIGRFNEHSAYPSFSNWKSIDSFCNYVLEVFEAKPDKYEEIYSRSMWPGSHFAAVLLKVKYPKIKWIAEFSDPLRVNVLGKERLDTIDPKWLQKNGILSSLSKKNYNVNLSDYLFYWCETLPYAFADSFIFTNESQKQYMLGMIECEALKEHVSGLSIVSQHPTLPNKFYELSNYNYNLNSDFINIGYFGSFYANRGIGDVLSAVQSLPQELREKVIIHIFTPQPESTSIPIDLKDNVEINGLLPYLDFLSVSRAFNVLVVNDAETKNIKWINPYLPSKLSDYRGSGVAIWALFEEGSELDNYHGISFKSKIGDITSGKSVLLEIISKFEI